MKKWLCFAALLCLLLAGCTPADPAVPDEPLTEPDKEPLIGQAKELVIAENGATRTTPMPHIPLRVWMRTEPICIP